MEDEIFCETFVSIFFNLINLKLHQNLDIALSRACSQFLLVNCKFSINLFYEVHIVRFVLIEL